MMSMPRQEGRDESLIEESAHFVFVEALPNRGMGDITRGNEAVRRRGPSMPMFDVDRPARLVLQPG